MEPRPLVDAPATPPWGARRAEVLALLRGAGRPLGIAEVAAATGLHPNTARFHLDGLVADGVVDRATEERATPGRRRLLFSVRAEAPGPRSYALLAEMLTGLVATLRGAGAAAVDAGRAWGRHLVVRAAPSQALTAGASLERLERLLDDVGFQPETVVTDDEVVVNLYHCPFREVAAQHTDVVCAIHLGLMRGALEELRAPVEATTLEPFVQPTLCVARLRLTGAGDGDGATA